MKILVICSVFLAAVFVQPTQGVSCPSCIHITYTISGLPIMYKNLIDSMLSQTMLANPDCLQATSGEMETCPATSFPGLVVNKCQSTLVTLTAKGLVYFSRAEMTVYVWVKNCLAVAHTQADSCTNVNDMDEATRAKFTAQVAQLSQTWNNVTYGGEVCISTP